MTKNEPSRISKIEKDPATIKIKKHTREDIQLRVKWLNNPSVNKYIGEEVGKGTTLKKEQEWFAEYEGSKDKQFFTIYDEPKPIGFMGLSSISKANKNADLFIAIGEEEYQGRGFGPKALEWLIEYGFTKLELHKINLGVIKDNAPAVKLYKSLGFVVEGEMKDEVFFEGEYHDFLSMAIFQTDTEA